MFDLGPRLLMNLQDVPATEVVQPGSRLSYRMLLAGEDDQLALLKEELPLKPNYRWASIRESSSSIGNALDRAESFLLLGGLLGVLLAGVAVGFVMGRRAGDSGLPHERGHLRTLGQAIGDDDGSEVEDVEEERLPGQGARLTAAQRSERLGCAGCAVWVPSNVCSKCDRWTGGAEHDECEKCRAEGEGEWVLVRPRARRDAPAREPAARSQTTSYRVADARVGVSFEVRRGVRQRGGTWAGKVRVAFTVNPGSAMQAVSRPERRTPPPEGVHVRIGAAQERRETRVSSEDPRAGVRALQSQPGAGGRCARTRQAQTVAERLRREGARKPRRRAVVRLGGCTLREKALDKMPQLAGRGQPL